MEVFIRKPSQALLSIKAVLKGSNTPYLLGGTGIGNTQPGIPMSYAITVGSRFAF